VQKQAKDHQRTFDSAGSPAQQCNAQEDAQRKQNPPSAMHSKWNQEFPHAATLNQ
jgi:hypothetical protein